MGKWVDGDDSTRTVAMILATSALKGSGYLLKPHFDHDQPDFVFTTQRRGPLWTACGKTFLHT